MAVMGIFMNLLDWLRPKPLSLAGEGWVLVPLGNPGSEYADTRHNLGRLMLQRWMADQGFSAPSADELPSGRLYRLTDGLRALVPGTYMNLSGQVCREAVDRGVDPARLILLFDDKDLPLGQGRFRPAGGAGGHNGVASVMEQLGTDRVARLRLGIGPFERPLVDFVLGTWTEPEQEKLDGLDVPFTRFLALLQASPSLEPLPGQVNASSFWVPDLENRLEQQGKG